MPSRKIEDCTYLLQNAWCDTREKFIEMYPYAPEPILTCTFRSNDEQADLYAQGRTEPGKIVTNIKANGKHNRKPAQAFDIAFRKKGGSLDWSGQNFRNFAAIMSAEYPMVTWGGNWKMRDLPHFEE
jgi:peptidoglycan L-alanyl-D-glutamate endopeptidase CwlK